MNHDAVIVTTPSALTAIVEAAVERAVSKLAPSERPMNVAAAAQFLGVSCWVIRDRIRNGILKARKNGRDYLIMPSELLKLAQGDR